MESRRLRYQWLSALIITLTLAFVAGGAMSLWIVKEEDFDDPPMFIIYPASSATCGGMTFHSEATLLPTPKKPTRSQLPPAPIRPLGLAPALTVPEEPRIEGPVEGDSAANEWLERSPW